MTAKCPICSSSDLTRRIAIESIPYGSGGDAVEIQASLPIQHCQSCGEEWEDAETFRAKHDAVCRHLGRLTSADVAALRGSIGSRERFAELTGLGAASLARWESGSHIQNSAYDLLLRVIADKRLREAVLEIRGRAIAALVERRSADPIATSRPDAGERQSNVIPLRRAFHGRSLTSAEEAMQRGSADAFCLVPSRLGVGTAKRATS